MTLQQQIDHQVHFYEVPPNKKKVIKREVILFKSISIDPNSKWFTLNGHRMKLNGAAFEVFYAICKRKGELITNKELSEEVFPDKRYYSQNPWVGLAINKARKDIGLDCIISTHGEGYKLNLNYGRSFEENDLQVA